MWQADIRIVGERNRVRHFFYVETKEEALKQFDELCRSLRDEDIERFKPKKTQWILDFAAKGLCTYRTFNGKGERVTKVIELFKADM